MIELIAGHSQDMSAFYGINLGVKYIFEKAGETLREIKELALNIFDDVKLGSGLRFFDIWSVFVRSSQKGLDVRMLRFLYEAKGAAEPNYDICLCTFMT